MPQATDAQRDLMQKWFGDPIDDVGPAIFLFSRGYTEGKGIWSKPTPAHTVSMEERECLRFLRDEWDYDYEV